MSGISRIAIEQQFAEIGVKSSPARLKISFPEHSMNISQEIPQMTLDRQAPTFEIDQKKLRSDMGLAGPMEFVGDVASKGKSTAMQSIAKTSDEGDYLADTTSPGNRVAQIAADNVRQMAKKDINLGLAPKDGAQIEWDPGFVNINWSGHNIKIEWDGEYMPEVMLDPPYSVEVFLQKEPYLRITVEEGVDPYAAGQFVDASL